MDFDLDILLLCFQFVLTMSLCIVSTVFCTRSKCCTKKTTTTPATKTKRNITPPEENVSVSAWSNETWTIYDDTKRGGSRTRTRTLASTRTDKRARELSLQDMMKLVKEEDKHGSLMPPSAFTPQQVNLLAKIHRKTLKTGRRGKCDHGGDPNWQPAVKLEPDIRTQDTLYYVEPIPEEH